MNQRWLRSQLGELQSLGFAVGVWDDYRRVRIGGIDLLGGVWTGPDGMPISHVSALIDIPVGFPIIVPGPGVPHPQHAIHIPKIKYNGYELSDLHKCSHDPWHWLCFRSIDWDPFEDNLISLVQLIEVTIYRRRR